MPASQGVELPLVEERLDDLLGREDELEVPAQGGTSPRHEQRELVVRGQQDARHGTFGRAGPPGTSGGRPPFALGVRAHPLATIARREAQLPGAVVEADDGNAVTHKVVQGLQAVQVQAEDDAP